MKPSITFIVPTHNDGETIESLIRSIDRVGKKACHTHEIIVIDDASYDKTPSKLALLKKHISSLSVMTHTNNQGYGATIYELYHSGKLPWLFSLPGDFQIDPSEVTKLIPSIRRADMILGRRVNRKETLFRQIQSRTYNILLRVFFGLKTHDVNTVRLMKRDIINSVTLTSRSAFVDAELVIKAYKKGYRILEVPITHKLRETGGATGGSITRTIVPTIRDMVHFAVRTV